MRKSVNVKIERFENEVVVSNNKGKVWKIPFESPGNNDASINGAVADIASAMLTGTIVSQLTHVNSTSFKYTLIVEVK